MSLTDSGHWYTRDGESAHEVPDGKDPTKMRSTSLADARKLLLVPSVTTCLKVYNSFTLNRWSNGKHAQSGADLANLRGTMSDWEWEKMVSGKAYEKRGEAADEGTQYHLVVESIVNNVDLPDYELTIPPEFFTGFSSWWHEMKLATYQTEVSFAHPKGFGGRMDFVGYDEHGHDVFIDWKTQNTKPSRPAGFYKDSMPLQLAAYMEGYKEKVAKEKQYIYHPRLISVVISRSEPGRIEHKEWPEDMHKTYLGLFYGAVEKWKYDNSYDPSWEEDE